MRRRTKTNLWIMFILLLFLLFLIVRKVLKQGKVEGLEEGKLKSCGHRMYNFPLLEEVYDVDKL
jgi:hypothetical protein